MNSLLPIDEILFNISPGETRAALVSAGRLIELLIERDAMASLIGNVYLGRVGKLASSMEAAFIELGGASRRAGFLARDAAKMPLNAKGEPARPQEVLMTPGPPSRTVSEGEAILVQVTKDAFGGKGPRLSTQLALPGHRIVLTPGRPGLSISRRITAAEERARLEAAVGPHLQPDEGIILRTAAEGVEAGPLLDELGDLRRLWQEVLARAKGVRAPAPLYSEPDTIHRILRDHVGLSLRRVFCDDRAAIERAKAFFGRFGRGEGVEVVLHQGPKPLFSRHDVEDQIAQALEPVVELPSGGSLDIGTLEALTAIDVNTARQAGPERFEESALAVNLEAAAEIARQVRLRNIAGLIVIDFVHMKKSEHRARVAEALRDAFAADPVPVQLGGMTPLGLFEMTRKRERESLRDALTTFCEACHGAGRLKSAVTVAYELLRAAERAADAASGRPMSVTVAPSVLAALDGEAKAARAALEVRLGRTLTVRAEPTYGRERFDIMVG